MWRMAQVMREPKPYAHAAIHHFLRGEMLSKPCHTSLGCCVISFSSDNRIFNKACRLLLDF